MDFIQSLMNLFGTSEPAIVTGAIRSPLDPRDIPVSAIKPEMGYTPKTYKTNIAHLTVMDQKKQPACVGYAHSQIVRDFEYKEMGAVTPISPRFYYALAKQVDGYSGEGTFPRIVADISRYVGGVDEKVVPSDPTVSKEAYLAVLVDEALQKEAYPHRTKGYAYVDHTDIERIKQAIFLYGLVELTISAGKRKGDGRMYPKEDATKLHRVVAYGYRHSSDRLKIYFINSWGTSFGEKGLGYFYLNDYLSVPYATSEWMIYTDIPNEVKEEYKKKWTMKYFSPSEKGVAGLDLKFLETLDRARGLSGTPYVITSGFRTPEENRNAGGQPNSSHLRGLAVDLACTDNFKRTKILKGLYDCGSPLFIEIGQRHIHVDADPSIHVLGQTMWSDDE